MDMLIEYSIPVRGLRNGTHQFDFQVDRAFFSQFENSPVTEGNVEVAFTLDKRPDMFILTFDLAGTVQTDCDRCLALIDLPVADTQSLIVKFIILAMPIIKVYDCESEINRPCNQEMLRYIQNGNGNIETEADSNPLWEELKKLNKNDN